MDVAPMKGEIGARLYREISQEAWGMWLKHSTMVINEYRLRLFDRNDRAKLDSACRVFLLLEEGEGPTVDYTPPSES